MWRLMAVFFSVFGLLPFSTPPANAVEKLALLVANQKYQAAEDILYTPYEDIQIVGDALRQIGFKTTIIADADYNTLQKGLQTYAGQVRAAGENAISFFYYSGHGVANPETGANYLIPVDADAAAPSSLWDKAFKLDTVVLELLNIAPSAFHFIVLDACRSQPNLTAPAQTTSALTRSKGWTPVQLQPGYGASTRFLLTFSTAPGMTASDRGGDASYSHILAEQLVRKGIESKAMFNTVNQIVRSKFGQEPWMNLPGFPDVYLAGSKVRIAKSDYRPPASTILLTPDEKEVFALDQEKGQLNVFERQPQSGGGLSKAGAIDLNHSGVAVKPGTMAINPYGDLLYITHPNGDEVIAVALKDNNKLTRIPIPEDRGRLPRSIAFNAMGSRAYVSNEGPIPHGSVAVIEVMNEDEGEMNRVLPKSTLGGLGCAEGMAVSDKTSRIYVATQCGADADPVFVIDIASQQLIRKEIIPDLAVGVAVAVSDRLDKLFVARGNKPMSDIATGKTGYPLTIVDLRTEQELRTILLDEPVNSVTLTPDERYALVIAGHTVAIVDAKSNRLVRTLRPRPSAPTGIVAVTDKSVFVNYGAEIYLFSLDSVVFDPEAMAPAP